MREITSVFEVFELKISGLTKVAFLKAFKMHNFFVWKENNKRGFISFKKNLKNLEKDKKN